jgi:F0F1-type ATP synthase assembly protein I
MDDPIPAPDADPGLPPAGPERAGLAGAAEFLTLGLTVAVVLVGLAALGYLVDRWLGTSPWFTLVGLALGIAAAVLITVSRVRRLL